MSDQVQRLISALRQDDYTLAELMQLVGLTHRATFQKNHLNPAIEAGLIERKIPDIPKSPKQKYRLKRYKHFQLWINQDISAISKILFKSDTIFAIQKSLFFQLRYIFINVYILQIFLMFKDKLAREVKARRTFAIISHPNS